MTYAPGGYRSGHECVGWHADDEELFDAVRRSSTIISLSLGSSRKFQIRCPSGQVRSHDLHQGDLLVMDGFPPPDMIFQLPKTIATDVTLSGPLGRSTLKAAA